MQSNGAYLSATMREVILDRVKQIAEYWCGNCQFFSDPFRVELAAVLPATFAC